MWQQEVGRARGKALISQSSESVERSECISGRSPKRGIRQSVKIMRMVYV